jgi:predicted Zn-dependent protease
MTDVNVQTQSAPIVMGRRELLQGLAAGTVIATLPACATNPETGRSQLVFVSDQQLAQMSASSWTQIRQQERVSTNSGHNATLQRVGQKITGAAGRGNERWEYAVFDNDEVNAFVLPGRQVGFYEGLMELADNEDQIATVMGHEVGHVAGRHAAERFSQTMLATGVMAAASVALEDSQYAREIGAVLGLGVQFGVLLPYSRQHELEADRLGARYMAQAGYRPMESVRFWEKMLEGGGPRQPAILSTHPAPETRLRELDQYIRNNGWV